MIDSEEEIFQQLVKQNNRDLVKLLDSLFEVGPLSLMDMDIWKWTPHR